jgi:hypothetical protein
MLDSLIAFNSVVGLVLVVITAVLLVRAGRASSRVDRCRRRDAWASFESIIDHPVAANAANRDRDYQSLSISLFFVVGWGLASSTCGWANSVAKGVLLNECRAEAENERTMS